MSCTSNKLIQTKSFDNNYDFQSLEDLQRRFPRYEFGDGRFINTKDQMFNNLSDIKKRKRTQNPSYQHSSIVAKNQYNHLLMQKSSLYKYLAENQLYDPHARKDGRKYNFTDYDGGNGIIKDEEKFFRKFVKDFINDIRFKFSVFADADEFRVFLELDGLWKWDESGVDKISLCAQKAMQLHLSNDHKLTVSTKRLEQQKLHVMEKMHLVFPSVVVSLINMAYFWQDFIRMLVMHGPEIPEDVLEEKGSVRKCWEDIVDCKPYLGTAGPHLRLNYCTKYTNCPLCIGAGKKMGSCSKYRKQIMKKKLGDSYVSDDDNDDAPMCKGGLVEDKLYYSLYKIYNEDGTYNETLTIEFKKNKIKELQYTNIRLGLTQIERSDYVIDELKSPQLPQWYLNKDKRMNEGRKKRDTSAFPTIKEYKNNTFVNIADDENDSRCQAMLELITTKKIDGQQPYKDFELGDHGHVAKCLTQDENHELYFFWGDRKIAGCRICANKQSSAGTAYGEHKTTASYFIFSSKYGWAQACNSSTNSVERISGKKCSVWKHTSFWKFPSEYVMRIFPTISSSPMSNFPQVDEADRNAKRNKISPHHLSSPVLIEHDVILSNLFKAFTPDNKPKPTPVTSQQNKQPATTPLLSEHQINPRYQVDDAMLKAMNNMRQFL